MLPNISNLQNCYKQQQKKTLSTMQQNNKINQQTAAHSAQHFSKLLTAATATTTTDADEVTMLPSGKAALGKRFYKNALIFSLFALLLIVMPTPSSAIADADSKLNLQPTKYSIWSKNVTYKSSTTYSAGGMKPLYDITHEIISFLLGKDPMPDGYIVFKDKDFIYGPKVQRNEWGDLIKHYWIILLIVLLVGLLIVSMPIIGLCFCCCRCAGACGGRSEPFDKKHDTCRRVFLGFLLILLATGLVFGVIAAFATNSIMQMGIDESTTAVRVGSNDTRMFLDATSKHIDFLLINNYEELSRQLKVIIKDPSSFIIAELEQQSMAVSLKYLSNFLSKLPHLVNELELMRNITNELRVYASQLNDGLRGVKRDLLHVLLKCEVQACKDVLNKYEIGSLDANGIHYDQLPDVTNIIDNLESLIRDDIASAGQRGVTELDNMRTHLNNTIEQYTPKIEQAIDEVGEKFRRQSNTVNFRLQKLANAIGNNTNKYTNIADEYLDEYGPYRFYVGIGVCSVLLLILLCLVFALMCGICGKRPDGYGDDCCNKGAGSRFLMFAVALIFLSISAIALICLIHFLLGIVAYRGVCTPLRDPQNDEMFAKFDSFINLNDILYPQPNGGQSASGKLPPFRISHLIAACKENKTLYEVLQLHNHIDLQELDDSARFKINQTLDKFVKGIDFKNSNIQILSQADKERILRMGESALKDFDPGQFIDNLNDTITKHSLAEIAIKLRETASKINTTDMKDVQVSLRNQALHLESYEHNLVIPMKNQSAKLIELAHNLDQTMRYKDKSFQESIPLLVNEIEQAQNFIQNDGLRFVRQTATTLTQYFASEIARYLLMLSDAVENKVGLCEPLARVYDAGIVAACNRIVDPMNGFWAAVGWSLLLFLPTLMVAVKLSGLYQKSDPYPGPLVESEYLYDAYSERDHIPLANGPKQKRRKYKDRRRRDYYEDSVGSNSHGVPPAASSGMRDTRYNDMAPKHWDGGPPRYQNPPMAPPASEYERPPPYYYPGATEQD